MAARAEDLFIGTTEVQHVPRPEPFKGQFASLVSAVTGVDPFRVNVDLVNAELADPDGTAYPLPHATFETGGTAVEITPVHNPFGERAETPEGVMELIDGQLEEDRGVALLTKAGSDPEDGSYRWTMLTGYYKHSANGDTGEKGGYHELDPAQYKAGKINRGTVLEQIRRSMEYMDVYVCTLEPTEVEHGREGRLGRLLDFFRIPTAQEYADFFGIESH